MAYLPTNSYLSAFERSFESFLQATPSASAHIPSPSYDQNNPNSQESISAILSTVNVTPGARSTLTSPIVGTPQHLRRITSYPSSQTTPRNDGAKQIITIQGSPLSVPQRQYGEHPSFNSSQTTPRIIKKIPQSPLSFSKVQYEGHPTFASSQTTPRIIKKIPGSPLSLTQGQYDGHQVLDPPPLRTPEAAPARKQPFTCGYCLKGFRKETTLSLHQCILRTPSSECGLCGKRFASEQSLSQHRCVAASEDQTKKTRRSSTVSALKPSRSSLSSGDRVEIEVPVTVVNTEIIFQEPSGIALILGHIIELDPQYETLEDAVIDGTEIETLPSQVRYVLADIREDTPQKNLPEAMDQMASDAGLSLKDLEDIFGLFAADCEEDSKPAQLPEKQKETPLKEQQKEVNGESLIQSTKKGEMSSTLDESFSGTKTPANNPSSRKMAARSVSLQKFTYFNDTPMTIVGTVDDSDDDDWLATNIKCKPCKKVFSSRSQYRKHLKTHSKAKKTVRKDAVSSVKGPQKVLTLDED